MESSVFLLVIFAAILHAIWNGMVKNFGDKVISVSAIVFGHVPMAIIVMLFLPLPTLEKNIAKSKLVIFKNCAHNVHLEQPDQFNHAIKNFLL